MTFHERGRMLRALALHLLSKKMNFTKYHGQQEQQKQIAG